MGIDAVELSTFGANWSSPSDYGIDDRIGDLARDRAEAAEKTDGRMRWVLGSMGTKLPGLGHTT